MTSPEVATESGDGGPELGDESEAEDVSGESLEEAEELAEEASGESEAPEPEGEPDVEEVDLTEDDLGGDAADLFTGTDDATSSSDDQDDEDSDDEDSDDGDALDALGQRGESMEEAINDGAARLAVVGLDDDEKEDLQDEFTEVFEAFRLGYFGSRFMEEYVFTDEDEEVDPTWGLLGACLTCTAFIVWMRPDGDEMVESAREAVEGVVGGALD